MWAGSQSCLLRRNSSYYLLKLPYTEGVMVCSCVDWDPAQRILPVLTTPYILNLSTAPPRRVSIY